MKQKGFFIANSKDISFSNVTVVGADGPAFDIEDCEDIVFTNCKNKLNRTGSECIAQKNSKNIDIK